MRNKKSLMYLGFVMTFLSIASTSEAKTLNCRALFEGSATLKVSSPTISRQALIANSERFFKSAVAKGLKPEVAVPEILSSQAFNEVSSIARTFEGVPTQSRIGTLTVIRDYTDSLSPQGYDTFLSFDFSPVRGEQPNGVVNLWLSSNATFESLKSASPGHPGPMPINEMVESGADRILRVKLESDPFADVRSDAVSSNYLYLGLNRKSEITRIDIYSESGNKHIEFKWTSSGSPVAVQVHR